jgi:3-methyladenine DNA glycosylase AlkC
VPYVQRSVANHLGDLLKDHPDAALATCERWLKQTQARGFDPLCGRSRRWIVSHALRLPAKKGERRAVQLRAAAKSGRRSAD